MSATGSTDMEAGSGGPQPEPRQSADSSETFGEEALEFLSDEAIAPSIGSSVPGLPEDPEPSWFVARIGRDREGPMPLSELQARAASGQISRDDLVWRSGLGSWVKAGTIKKVFPDGVGRSAVEPPPLPGRAFAATTESAKAAMKQVSSLRYWRGFEVVCRRMADALRWGAARLEKAADSLARRDQARAQEGGTKPLSPPEGDLQDESKRPTERTENTEWFGG